MPDIKRPVGRPHRYAKFDAFEGGLPPVMSKRPLYCEGIGLFRGSNSYTAWVKVRLPRGGIYKGRTIPCGGSVEHKLGKRSSWNWPQLIAERDRLQGLADRGEPLEPEDIPTFAAYATQWLERKKNTLRSYGVTKGNVNSALIPEFGRRALDAIAVGDVNRWIGKQSAKLKPASVQRQLNIFNAIMNDAVRNGHLTRNPAAFADRIRGIEARQRFVTDDEWERILSTADEIEAAQEGNKELYPKQRRGWLRHYVAWAYNSGMRRAEILNLTFNHVRQIANGPMVIEVANTKTGKPRFVTCTQEMERIVEALKGLDRSEEDSRLFPVSLSTLKRSLARLWQKTGLVDVRLHDLRRTHATILIQRNIDPRTVAGRLGHSGTAMLARHYAVDRGDLEAAKAFSKASDLEAP